MRRTALAPVLVSLALVGCSRSQGAEEAVRAAPERTVAARTARVSQRLTLRPRPPAQGGGAHTVTGEGTVELDSRRADLTFTIGSQTSRSVLVGRTLYRELPPDASRASGKPWLKLDVDRGGARTPGAEGLQSLLEVQYNDPAKDLDYLREARRVSGAGEDTVRGVRTRRYRAVVDLTGGASPPSQEPARALGDVAKHLGLTSMAVEVWLDAEGRVRRIDQTLELPEAIALPNVPAEALPQRAEMTLELFDFGTPVTVTIPPPEQVADPAELEPRPEPGDSGGSGTPSPATDALQLRLLRSVPPTYQQQPDSVGDTGPSDLEKAVRDEDSPDGRQVLTSTGFVAGYQRLWADGQGGAVIGFLYQFGSEAGAQDYFKRAVARAAEEAVGGSTTPFTVPDVPGGRGLQRSDPEGDTAVVFLARGSYVAQILVQGPDAATPDFATRLAREQYLLLG